MSLGNDDLAKSKAALGDTPSDKERGEGSTPGGKKGAQNAVARKTKEQRKGRDKAPVTRKLTPGNSKLN